MLFNTHRLLHMSNKLIQHSPFRSVSYSQTEARLTDSASWTAMARTPSSQVIFRPHHSLSLSYLLHKTGWNLPFIRFLISSHYTCVALSRSLFFYYFQWLQLILKKQIMNYDCLYHFLIVNENGEAVYVKWHLKTDQGIKNLPASEADRYSPATALTALLASLSKIWSDLPNTFPSPCLHQNRIFRPWLCYQRSLQRHRWVIQISLLHFLPILLSGEGWTMRVLLYSAADVLFSSVLECRRVAICMAELSTMRWYGCNDFLSAYTPSATENR